MKSFLIIVVAAAFLLASAPGQKMDSKPENADARAALTRFEDAFADALARGDFDALEDALDEDFQLTGARGVSDRAAFVNALRRRRVRLASVSRDRASLRLEGDARAASTGRVTLSTASVAANDNQSTGLQIKAEPITVSRTATVNMRELARREAARPPATQTQGVAAPQPGTIDDSPAIESDARAADSQQQRYRYTVVYVKRDNRWRVASLSLSPDDAQR
jgi:hypothetical protein